MTATQEEVRTTPRGTPCARSWDDAWIARVERREDDLDRRICGARTIGHASCPAVSDHASGRCGHHGGFALTGAPDGNRNAAVQKIIHHSGTEGNREGHEPVHHEGHREHEENPPPVISSEGEKSDPDLSPDDDRAVRARSVSEKALFTKPHHHPRAAPTEKEFVDDLRSGGYAGRVLGNECGADSGDPDP